MLSLSYDHTIMVGATRFEAYLGYGSKGQYHQHHAHDQSLAEGLPYLWKKYAHASQHTITTLIYSRGPWFFTSLRMVASFCYGLSYGGCIDLVGYSLLDVLGWYYTTIQTIPSEQKPIIIIDAGGPWIWIKPLHTLSHHNKIYKKDVAYCLERSFIQDILAHKTVMSIGPQDDHCLWPDNVSSIFLNYHSLRKNLPPSSCSQLVYARSRFDGA